MDFLAFSTLIYLAFCYCFLLLLFGTTTTTITSVSLSLVRRIQLLRPLPLNSVAAATETAEESSEERSDSESSVEEEEEETNDEPPKKIEFAEWKGKRDKKKAEDHRRQKELENSQVQRKHKKKKQKELDPSEEDSYHSVPHSQEYLHSQKHQRVTNHPSMAPPKPKKKTTAGGSKTAKKKSKKQRPGVEDSEADETEVSTLGSHTVSEAKRKEARKEILRDKLDKMQNELTEYLDAKSKKGLTTSMESRVNECARKFLFKMTKFTTDSMIADHVDWVIDYLNPSELEEFEEFPDLHKKALNIWHRRYSDAVRTGLNSTSNQKRQDFIKLFAKMPENNFNPDNFPLTGEDMEALVFRKGMGDKDKDHQARIGQWANVIDILLPKVSDPEAPIDESEARVADCHANTPLFSVAALCLRLPPTTFGSPSIGVARIRSCVTWK